MIHKADASEFIPSGKLTLPVLRKAVHGCEGCDLHQLGGQAVFGEGPAKAKLVLVGEQPGDMEEKAGKPFVGPTGRVLDQALEQSGIDRNDVYITNAVKHFAFIMRGKRRMHDTPKMRHVKACRPWLEAELELLAPEGVVCMGATAAKSLLGSEVRITRDRGKLFTGTPWAPRVLVTEHPSAIVRLLSIDRSDYERRLAGLVLDLRMAIGS
jgi:uracil-DNA glycosylase